MLRQDEMLRHGEDRNLPSPSGEGPGVGSIPKLGPAFREGHYIACKLPLPCQSLPKTPAFAGVTMKALNPQRNRLRKGQKTLSYSPPDSV